MPSLRHTAVRVFAGSYTLVFLALAIAALAWLDYDMHRVYLDFLVPFYVLSLALQYVLPKVRAPLEKGELATDLLSNGGVLLLNMLQASLVAWAFHGLSTSLVVRMGWSSPSWTLASLPFVLQVLLGMLVFDLFFYTTHRLAHEVPWLWRFHSVHHCAHRVSFLNAYRAHPLDAAFRRFIPLFALLLAGPSQHAYVAAVTLGTVLATVTHLNIDLRHGWINYVIGTNEMHRWHHSTVYAEARNFGVFMIWDQLFGTYFNPRDRDMPARIGIGNEAGYPLHNYWKQLLLPFRWPKPAAGATGSAGGPSGAMAGAVEAPRPGQE